MEISAHAEATHRFPSTARVVALLLSAPLAASTLTGCVVVGASSRGGFFLWPGGLGLVVLILLVLFLLRRR